MLIQCTKILIDDELEKDYLKDDLIFDYLRALTNLYGIVPKYKVAEIFNMQNDYKINASDIDNAVNVRTLDNEIFAYYDNYFVEVSIIYGNYFEELLNLQNNKTYYIPEKNELLKYTDQFYYEEIKEFQNLKKFIKDSFLNDDEILEGLCTDIQILCGKTKFSIDAINQEFKRRNVNFENKKLEHNIFSLVMDLYYNSRTWTNRGFTPKEYNLANEIKTN